MANYLAELLTQLSVLGAIFFSLYIHFFAFFPIFSMQHALDKDEYLKIMNRRDAFRNETSTTDTIIPTIITTFGLSGGAYSNLITVQLDMNALFL